MNAHGLFIFILQAKFKQPLKNKPKRKNSLQK